MHERERRGGGLQRMAPVVAREAVVARVAGASPVTAREAVVAREDLVASTVAPVASTAALVASTTAPVALMRPRGSCGVGGGSGGVDGAWLWWRRRRQETAAKWGDGESGRRRRGVGRGIWGRSGGRGETVFWLSQN